MITVEKQKFIFQENEVKWNKVLDYLILNENRLYVLFVPKEEEKTKKNRTAISVYDLENGNVLSTRLLGFVRFTKIYSLPNIGLFCHGCRFGNNFGYVILMLCPLTLTDRFDYKTDHEKILEKTSRIHPINDELLLLVESTRDFKLNLYFMYNSSTKEKDNEPIRVIIQQKQQVTDFLVLPNEDRFVLGGHDKHKERMFIQIFDWKRRELVEERYVFKNRRSVKVVANHNLNRLKYIAEIPKFAASQGQYSNPKLDASIREGEHSIRISRSSFLSTCSSSAVKSLVLVGAGDGIHVLDKNGKKARKVIRDKIMYPEKIQVDRKKRLSICSLWHLFKEVFLGRRNGRLYHVDYSTGRVGRVEVEERKIVFPDRKLVWLKKGKFEFLSVGDDEIIRKYRLLGLPHDIITEEDEEEVEGEDS